MRFLGGIISGVAVEINTMEADLAVVTALLLMPSKVDIHRLGSTALGVLDESTLLGATLDLLTDGVIRHLVVELKITVELDGDLNLLDGETLLFLVTAIELGWLVLLHLVLDTLGVESALGKGIALTEAVGTAPAS